MLSDAVQVSQAPALLPTSTQAAQVASEFREVQELRMKQTSVGDIVHQLGQLVGIPGIPAYLRGPNPVMPQLPRMLGSQ